MFSKSNLFRSHYKTGRKWLACLSIILLLISMVPGNALGADQATMEITYNSGGSPVNPADLTEKLIRDNGLLIEITLTDNEWASYLASPTPSLINTLKGGFSPAGASEDADTWQELLPSSADKYQLMTTSVANDTLQITIPATASYNIHSDQTIEFTPPASLLQDSSNIPEAESFTIIADPQAALSGSLTDGVTESDIVAGGKQLIITLVNCEWAADITKSATKRSTLFGALKTDVDPAQWDYVKNALISAPEPSKIISVNDSNTELEISLPKVPDYNISGKQTITVDEDVINGLITGGQLEDNIINNSFDISDSFIINPDSNTITWYQNQIPTITESTITNAELKLQLDNNTWASDIIGTNSAKRTALLNGFTASTDVSAWNTLKAAILSDSNLFNLNTTKDILTITIPSTPGYSISEDQLITINVPSTVLANNYPISNSLTFTITADPAVAVSGTLTEGTSEVDIASGGKTIIATLTNATWATDVTTDITKREQLLDDLLSLKAGDSWPDTILDTIKAEAKYHLDNPATVTITLPPVPGFNISDKLTIEPTDTLPSLTTPALKQAKPPIPPIIITPIENQSASLSGTVSTATESDIVAGGKTLVITLKDDVWAQDIESNQSKINELISQITANSTAWVPVQTASDIVRTSDTVLTITLPPAAAYALTADQTINVNIPAGLLTSSNDQIPAGSFTVKAITASLSGTAVSSLLDSKAIISGGKTIIITLTNATWASDLKTDANKLNDLKDCFSSTGTQTNWNTIKNNISFSNLTLKGNVLTINLPPIPSYSWNDTAEQVTLNASADKLSSLINEKIGSGKNLTDTTNIIQIGETAQSSVSAALSGTAVNMNKAAVVSGGKQLRITLSGGTWDPSLPTNISKIKTLVKGFTADTDSTSWAVVQAALSSSSRITDHSFQLNSDNTELTINLPAVPNYDPIKDQTVSLVIPKSLLTPKTEDVPAGQVHITLPGFATQVPLETSLSDGSFVNYINNKPLSEIYLDVPPMHITSVASKQSEIGDTVIHSLDIYTSDNVQSVKVVVNDTETYTSNTPFDDEGTRRFNVGFATLNNESESKSSFDLKISVMDNSSNELQPALNLKISKSKTYAIAPKTDLSGSYSLYKLVNSSSLLKNILKYYLPNNINVRTLTS